MVNTINPNGLELPTDAQIAADIEAAKAKNIVDFIKAGEELKHPYRELTELEQEIADQKAWLASHTAS